MFGTLFVILCVCGAALLKEMDTNVDVQINKINESHIIGICSCSSPPYGESAEFLIDNKTVASISLIDKVCFIKRRPCETHECSCTSTQFKMTFKTPDEILFALTCQVRIVQEKLERHLKVFKTKTFNGKDIIGDNTYIEQISLANGDSTQLKTNSTTERKRSDNKRETELVPDEGGKVEAELALLAITDSTTQEKISVTRLPESEQKDLDDEDTSSTAPSIDTYEWSKENSCETLNSNKICCEAATYKQAETNTPEGTMSNYRADIHKEPTCQCIVDINKPPD